MSETPDTARLATLDAMLDAAGVIAAPAEREELMRLYALFKPGVDALYAVPEARYEAPALVFQADPPLETWGT